MTVAPATARVPGPGPTAPGRLRWIADFYATLARMSVIEQFQYRAANYFYMVGTLAEPLIYLVVWTTVARAQGGEVGGFTPGDFAAYYIVWMLVRNMNITFTPYGWEWRIRQGKLSEMLLRPVHPLHYDIAYFAGWKVFAILLWVPAAVVLSLLFDPSLDVTALEVAVFSVAIWGAYLLRTLLLWLLGMMTFWTTRVSAAYEVFFTAELLLSGRLVPLALMPPWVIAVADVLPFKWTFGFPIEALVADLSTAELLGGLGLQALWVGAALGAVALMWRFAVRRYAAVGN